MPKKCNTKKSASAALQCMKAIAAAAKGTDPNLFFASVHSAKGNGFFTLRLEDGAEVRGTPRGLFTSGNMRVSPGQIVVASGDKRGMEIVGVIQDRTQAEELVADGKMPRSVLTSAVGAGGFDMPEEEEDDLFETTHATEAVEEVSPHGVRAARAMAENRRAITKRLAALVGKVGSVCAPPSLIPMTSEIDIDAI